MTTLTPPKPVDEPFGEVIFSTSEMILAQCYKEVATSTEHKNSILKGSVVKIVSSYDSSYVAYGLITNINNSSLDNIHKPSALGLNFKQLTELQPQVYELLRNELEIYLFAHTQNNGEMVHYPPLKPMTIHDFVHKASEKEVLELTDNLSNLINVVKKSQQKPDILVDVISLGYRLRKSDYKYLVKAGKELSIALADEMDTLMQILKRLSTCTGKPLK